MIGPEVATYRRLRLLVYGGLLAFGVLTFALTGDRDPAVVMMIAIAGVVSSHRTIPMTPGWLIGFDLIAAVGMAWFGRPLFGLVIAIIALGMGSLGRDAKSFKQVLVGAWLGIFAVAGIAMIRLEVIPAGFGTGRQVLARAITSAAAATVLLMAALGVRRVRDAIVETERLNATLDRRLTHLIGASSMPMAMVDTDGKILRANRAFGELLGRDESELTGALDADLTHPGDFAIGAGLLAEADGTRKVEKRYVHGSGRQVFTQVTAIAEGPASHPNLWLLQINDLSDLRRARAEAVVTRMELDSLFERIPVALYRSLPSGEVIAGNPELATLLGYDSIDELIASVDAAKAGYRDPADRERWKQMMDAKGTVIAFEQEMIRSDGATLVVSDSATAIRNADGSVNYYEGVLVDVTARTLAEASQRRLAAVLSATSDIVVMTDASGTVLYANEAMAEFASLTNSVGDNIVNIVPRGGQGALGALVAEAAVAGTAVGDIELVLPSGKEAVLSVVVQKHDPDRDGLAYFSGIGRDVTDERATAHRLEALIKSKDEFIASVSHELRTPLTAAVGIAFELRDGVSKLAEGERAELTTLMAEQTQEVANLVEDLLVAARMDTDSVSFLAEEVDLRRAVTSALKTVSYEGDHPVEVDGDARAIADGRRVRQILRNLLTNASRYGGSDVSVQITPGDTEVAIRVSDNGPGIEPAERDRIFDAYQSAHTTATQPNSVGLGLTVSRWLARGMGGDLTYQYNGASVFILTLPIRAEP